MSIYRIASICMALMLVTRGATGDETRTLTGEDLFNNPAVIFPTTAPSLDGKSLVFETGAAEFEKLLVLPLIPGGRFNTSHLPITLTAWMKLTHLECINECTGNPDFEPWIGFGDGKNIIGARTADDSLGQGFAFTLTDDGAVGSNPVTNQLFDNAGYPDLGESFAVLVRVTIQETGTTVNLSYLGGSGRFSSRNKLDTRNDINLILLRDNDIGQQYRLNSALISITLYKGVTSGDIYDPDDREFD